MKNIKNINVGQFTDSYQVPSVISKEDAWKLLEAKINSEKITAAKSKTIIVNWKIVSLVSVAAVIVIVLWFGLNINQNYSPAISTSLAESKICWLPDSSKVELNSNSSISYRYNKFTGERNVNIKGDALFEVEKGKKFIVGFKGGEVKVTGTAFYVSAYSPELLQVDCFKGSVEVTISNQTFSLNKGKGLRMYNGKLTGPFSCDENDVRERLNGVFYWNRISLPEIADLIGYRFGYKINIDPSLLNRNFSGRLDLNDLHQGLLVVSMAMNVDFIIDEDQKIISLNAK
jgi:transmembrane sensor